MIVFCPLPESFFDTKKIFMKHSKKKLKIELKIKFIIFSSYFDIFIKIEIDLLSYWAYLQIKFLYTWNKNERIYTTHFIHH